MKNEIDEPEPPDDDTPEHDWNGLPMHIRMFVYAAIDAMEAEASKRKADAILRDRVRAELAQVTGKTKTVEDDASEDAVVEASYERAWHTVGDLLRMMDWDYCEHCGRLHEPEKPHIDPKGLS